MTKPRIYLAGRVSKNDWRGGLGVDGANRADPGRGFRESGFPEEERARYIFTGPTFMGCDHGCAHGSGRHGLVDMWDCTGDDFGASRGYIVKHCLAAIDRSDVLFAWLELEAYGTVAEIGYARAKGKRIFVAGPGGVPWTPTPAADPAYPGELAPDREVWFARQLADYCIPFDLVSTPLAAVEVMLDHLVPVSAPVTESPIEEMFLTSLLRTAPAAACRVMCQQKIGPYRVDFAFPDCRVVVECDGHDYHEKTKEQARRDKRRDRYLTGEGWRVYRFTGSEIFQNADRCVAEIVSVLPAPPPPPSQESLRERKRNTK